MHWLLFNTVLFPALHEISVKMRFQTQQNKFLAVGPLNLPLLSEAVGSKVLCAAQGACISLFFSLPFLTALQFQKMSFQRIPEDDPWGAGGCMGLARMQLVCAVSTGWEAGAWPGTGWFPSGDPNGAGQGSLGQGLHWWKTWFF